MKKMSKIKDELSMLTDEEIAELFENVKKEKKRRSSGIMKSDFCLYTDLLKALYDTEYNEEDFKVDNIEGRFKSDVVRALEPSILSFCDFVLGNFVASRRRTSTIQRYNGCIPESMAENYILLKDKLLNLVKDYVDKDRHELILKQSRKYYVERKQKGD